MCVRSKRERFDKPPLCLTSANTHTIAMTTASASTPVKFPDDFDESLRSVSIKEKFLVWGGWKKGASKHAFVGVVGQFSLHPQKAMCMPPESLRHSKLLLHV